jgi:hypothetical protein
VNVTPLGVLVVGLAIILAAWLVGLVLLATREAPVRGRTANVYKGVDTMHGIVHSVHMNTHTASQSTTEDALTGGYGEAALRAAFERVQDPTNWKNPINAPVAADADRELIATAIIFYTGSTPTFQAIYRGPQELVGYIVRAAGYYAAVGA